MNGRRHWWLTLWSIVRDGAGFIANIVQIATIPGLALVALVYGGVLTWLGWLANVPWFYVAAIFPVGALCLIVLMAWSKKLRYPQLDIEPWIGNDSYQVWIAACLWAEVPLSPKIDETHPAYPKLHMIKSALQTGRIRSMWGNNGAAGEVHHEQLRLLAQTRGERPRFLFGPSKP